LYDEELIRNQDNELNERILKNGGMIYLIPSIKIKYFARENYSKLWKMLYQYGYFGPLVDLKLRKKTRLRRYIPALFVLSLLMPLLFCFITPLFILIFAIPFSLYTFINIIVSASVTIKQKLTFLFPYLFLGFWVAHISYGVGYLSGVLDFKIFKKHSKKKLTVELSR
jgi:asparagine N-glycosylation enzyme membrane subunit Stt3